LGNQPEEYELKEDYLEWLPKSNKSWEDFILDYLDNIKLTIVNPADKTEKTIFWHHFIMKDAFPMSFYVEEITKKWSIFAIVSETETSEKFVIPLY